MRRRRTAAAVAVALASVAATARPVPTERWEQWRSLPGVFDIVGPRTDGRLVAAGSGRLFLVTDDGTISPYADGSGGALPWALAGGAVALALLALFAVRRRR